MGVKETARWPVFFPPSAAIVLRGALEAKIQACFMLLCETPAQVYFLFHSNLIAGFYTAAGQVITGRTGFSFEPQSFFHSV